MPGAVAERSGGTHFGRVVPLILALAAAVVLHARALRAPFFADDYLFLDQVRSRSLVAALISRDPIGNFFRPLGRQLHFWWLARASGESPFVFHLANLALFLLSLTLLFALARRLAGPLPATIAVSIVALHSAADVPVMWASGSQELIALVGALFALWLCATGRAWLAALALLGALLAKETVVFTPLIAVVLARRRDEPWRASLVRAAPLAAAVAVWACLVFAVRARDPGVAALAPTASGFAAAVLHLVQVTVGLEWAPGTSPLAVPFAVEPHTVVALALAAGALILAEAAIPDRTGHAVAVGALWAVAGALPVAAVASIWSGYFYLFALCGAALAIGAMLARAPRPGVAIVVLLLGWNAQRSASVQQFAAARDPWTPISHVNRFYLERGMTLVDGALSDLQRARPTLAPRTVLFFAGLPAFMAFQAGDGPLVRWAYRDSSLRSYFLNDFSAAKVSGRPFHLFTWREERLVEEPASGDELKRMALAMLVSDSPASARDALLLQSERQPDDLTTRWWTCVAMLAAGDRARFEERSRALAASLPGTPGRLSEVAALIGGSEFGRASALAVSVASQSPDDGRLHGELAELLLSRVETQPYGAVEALAARALAPQDPLAWRRWAITQLLYQRHLQATRSLDRYFALGGEAARADTAAVRWRAELARVIPGGDFVQTELSNDSRP